MEQTGGKSETTGLEKVSEYRYLGLYDHFPSTAKAGDVITIMQVARGGNTWYYNFLFDGKDWISDIFWRKDD